MHTRVCGGRLLRGPNALLPQAIVACWPAIPLKRKRRLYQQYGLGNATADLLRVPACQADLVGRNLEPPLDSDLAASLQDHPLP